MILDDQNQNTPTDDQQNDQSQPGGEIEQPKTEEQTPDAPDNTQTQPEEVKPETEPSEEPQAPQQAEEEPQKSEMAEDTQQSADDKQQAGTDSTPEKTQTAEEPQHEETPAEETPEATTAETSKTESDDEPKDKAVDPTAKKSKDPDGAHWYVVHTYSGHEAKVAATLKQRVESQKLADKILDILVPTQEKIEIKEGKKTNVKEKIFPGYLLIKMVLDDNTWLAVRTTPGITSFVGNANKPTPLPEEEVAGIRRFMEMEAPTFKTAFSVGEAVRITDGPFSEFLGSINEIDEEKGKLKVMVSIFGRETPVELDFLQVAKL